MKNGIRTHPLSLALLAALFLALLVVTTALAAGNIDATNKWAWSTNAGWINFAPDNGGVTVFSDHLEGYAWAENIGWVRLGTCSGSSCTHTNTTAANYGVNNDGVGNLSGYAWGTNVGWINFNPSNGGVTVDPATGSFDGYAWGENIGWSHFKNSSPAYNVVTTLYPVATATPTTTSTSTPTHTATSTGTATPTATPTGTPTATDADPDGVEDSIEAGVPSPGGGKGDGNGDGIPDLNQSDVASLPNAADGGYLTLVSNSGVGLQSVKAISPTVATPAGVALPQGLLTFQVSVTVGSVYSATLILHAGTPPAEYWKYGPTPDDPTDHWYEFTYNGETGAVIVGNRVTLHFVDGKRGDSDLSANGVIVDPGGPALRTIHRRWLPWVAKQQPGAPDLIVERLLASPNAVQVVIKNVGQSTATDDFWVDVYLAPATAPTAVNQRWNDLASQGGAVWGVTQDLAPGQSLTLSLGDAFYSADYSFLAPNLPAGTPVYAQVDSWNPATNYGAVHEQHEIVGQPYNNIAQTTVTVGVRIESQEHPASAMQPAHLPDRPPVNQ